MNRSNVEEIIGVLWLILSAILYQGGASKWQWGPTLFMGLSSIVFSILFAVIDRIKERIIAKIQTLKASAAPERGAQRK